MPKGVFYEYSWQLIWQISSISVHCMHSTLASGWIDSLILRSCQAYFLSKTAAAFLALEHIADIVANFGEKFTSFPRRTFRLSATHVTRRLHAHLFGLCPCRLHRPTLLVHNWTRCGAWILMLPTSHILESSKLRIKWVLLLLVFRHIYLSV